MADPTCPTHGAGYGTPCYLCVDDDNRVLRARIATLERERDEARELLSAARRAGDLPRVGECAFEGRDRMAAFLGMMTMHKAGIATFHDENACEVYIAQWLSNRGRAALRGQEAKPDV